MRFYLASYIDDPIPADDPDSGLRFGTWFRAPIEGPHEVIDLRPDGGQLSGRSLIWTPEPVTVPSEFVDLGDALDEQFPRGVSRALERTLGVTLDQTDRLRAILAELLILHGDGRPNGIRSRWKPLKPNHRGRHVLRFGGQVIFDAPAVVGTTLNETWTTADADDPSGDHTWAEVDTAATSDWDVVSNQIARKNVASGHTSIRLESDLASDDHYAQAVVKEGVSSSSNTWMLEVRFSASAVTLYTFWTRQDDSEKFLFKYVAGSRSTITNDSNAGDSFAPDDTLKLEVDGSSLEGFYNGASVITGTDTEITGNTRIGVGGTAVDDDRIQWDTLEAADLGAASDPANLQATVDGSDVTLTWDASF